MKRSNPLRESQSDSESEGKDDAFGCSITELVLLDQKMKEKDGEDGTKNDNQDNGQTKKDNEVGTSQSGQHSNNMLVMLGLQKHDHHNDEHGNMSTDSINTSTALPEPVPAEKVEHEENPLQASSEHSNKEFVLSVSVNSMNELPAEKVVRKDSSDIEIMGSEEGNITIINDVDDEECRIGNSSYEVESKIEPASYEQIKKKIDCNVLDETLNDDEVSIRDKKQIDSKNNDIMIEDEKELEEEDKKVDVVDNKSIVETSSANIVERKISCDIEITGSEEGNITIIKDVDETDDSVDESLDNSRGASDLEDETVLQNIDSYASITEVHSVDNNETLEKIEEPVTSRTGKIITESEAENENIEGNLEQIAIPNKRDQRKDSDIEITGSEKGIYTVIVDEIKESDNKSDDDELIDIVDSQACAIIPQDLSESVMDVQHLVKKMTESNPHKSPGKQFIADKATRSPCKIASESKSVKSSPNPKVKTPDSSKPSTPVSSNPEFVMKQNDTSVHPKVCLTSGIVSHKSTDIFVDSIIQILDSDSDEDISLTKSPNQHEHQKPNDTATHGDDKKKTNVPVMLVFNEGPSETGELKRVEDDGSPNECLVITEELSVTVAQEITNTRMSAKTTTNSCNSRSLLKRPPRPRKTNPGLGMTEAELHKIVQDAARLIPGLWIPDNASSSSSGTVKCIDHFNIANKMDEWTLEIESYIFSETNV